MVCVQGEAPVQPAHEEEHSVLSWSCTVQHLLNCQFSEWYPLFSHCSPKTVVLPLGEAVVKYLGQDGVILPRGFEMSSGRGQGGSYSDDEGNWEDADGQQDGDAVTQLEFPELLQQITTAIQQLGGSVFPKLNWSCPKDAAWMNGGSLRCRTPGDVVCLLKSSAFITHDLIYAVGKCEDASLRRPQPMVFTLVLRKWCTLRTSMLFRCFVGGGRLLGVSQRDCGRCFPFLAEDGPRLAQKIQAFVMQQLCPSFPDPHFVADIYLDRQQRVWLLDMNCFSPVTDSLLFDWDDLRGAATATATTITSTTAAATAATSIDAAATSSHTHTQAEHVAPRVQGLQAAGCNDSPPPVPPPPQAAPGANSGLATEPPPETGAGGLLNEPQAGEGGGSDPTLLRPSASDPPSPGAAPELEAGVGGGESACSGAGPFTSGGLLPGACSSSSLLAVALGHPPPSPGLGPGAKPPPSSAEAEAEEIVVGPGQGLSPPSVPGSSLGHGGPGGAPSPPVGVLEAGPNIETAAGASVETRAAVARGSEAEAVAGAEEEPESGGAGGASVETRAAVARGSEAEAEAEAAAAAEEEPESESGGAGGGFLSVGGQAARLAGFELRVVPGGLRALSDTLGGFRGPEDVSLIIPLGGGSGGGVEGGGGGVSLQELIERCQAAQADSSSDSGSSSGKGSGSRSDGSDGEGSGSSEVG